MDYGLIANNDGPLVRILNYKFVFSQLAHIESPRDFVMEGIPSYFMNLLYYKYILQGRTIFSL